ncbi:unnamed protein product [Linum trigynum]|uniref:Uncharacterized protein n=2 Tax=Linum trigynum TaxID=586398 RepID=A0AAV2DVD5_9ROSI
MSSERPSREELINQAIQMLDSVIATCGKMIASYDKHMSATTPTQLRVETLAAMEKAEIAIPPIVPAPPPSQAEALVEFVEDEEEDAVGAKPVQSLSLSSFPLAAPTSVSQPLPLQFKILTAMEAVKITPQSSPVAPLVIAPLLSMPTAVGSVDIAPLSPQIEKLLSSPIASPVHTTDLPSIVIELESPLEPAALTAPFSPSLDGKHHHVGKLQTLLVKGRPRQINGYVLSLGIRITTKCVIYNRGRRILGQINPWRFRKKRETSLGMFGVDGHCLNWWKRKKGRANIAKIVKKWDKNLLLKGKLDPPTWRETMPCTIDSCYIDEVFDEKIYKWKHEEKATAAADNDNDESMDVDASLPPTAMRVAVPSADNPHKPTFKTLTHGGVIIERVSQRNWKRFRKHLLWPTVMSRQVTWLEEKMN